MYVLICNSIAYWLTAFFFRYKYGFNLLTFLWFYYAFFSSCGCFLMLDDVYFVFQRADKSIPICVEPYIYLYLSFWAITWPLKAITINKISVNQSLFRNDKLLSIVRKANILATVYVFVKLIQIYFVMQIGFGVVHDMEDSTHIIYPGTAGMLLRFLNIIGRLNNMIIMPIVVLYIFKGYIAGCFTRRYTFKYIFPYCIGTILMGFVGGSRGAIFFGIMNVLFFFIILFDSLSSMIKRRLLVALVAFMAIIVIVVLQITTQRFEEQSDVVWYSILDYMGQMFPNINYKIWNQVEHPMGMRMFPALFGSKSFNNDYWFYQNNISGWLFSTLWGCLYIEFGKYVPLFILLVYYKIIRRYLRKNIFYIYDVVIIMYIYYIAFSSLFNYALSSTDYISLILIICFYKYAKAKKLFNV